MTRILHIILFLPALLGWVLFAPFFYLANRLTKVERYRIWKFFGVTAEAHTRTCKRCGKNSGKAVYCSFSCFSIDSSFDYEE